MMLSSGRMVWIQMVVATLLLCSCGPSHDASDAAPQFSNWPSEFDNFRFHWSAAPGIDLTSAPAVAVRAYVESYQLALLAQNADAVYPGFLNATPENIPQLRGTPVELTHIRPGPFGSGHDLKSDATPEFFGYQPSYVLSLEKIDDGYRAIVCEGYYATYRNDDTPPGQFRSNITLASTGGLQYGDWESVGVRRIELTDKDARGAGGEPTNSLVPEQGPLPAPTGDVFGQWFITAASGYLWGPSGDAVRFATPDVQEQCFDHMPDDAATRKAMYTGFHDAPPPHGDPIPGWPNA